MNFVRLVSVMFAFFFLADVARCNQSYYFAIRTDDPSDPASYGSGTQADPFDGRYINGESRFDKNMQIATKSFVQPANGQNQIYLAQGIYWTWGDDGGYAPQPEYGFLLPSHTLLKGDGMGKTIIKLIGIHYLGGRGDAHVTVASGTYGGNIDTKNTGVSTNCDWVTVQDLTVDANADQIFPIYENGARTSGNITVWGVRTNGSHVRITNVEVLRAYGIWGHEAAAIHTAADAADCSDVQIEGCRVDKTYGDYTNSFNFFPGPNGVFRITGSIKRCTVVDNAWAAFNATPSGSVETLLIGNTVTNSNVGYYWDTSSQQNITLKYNTFCTNTVNPEPTFGAYAVGLYSVDIGVPLKDTPPAPIQLGNLQILNNYFSIPGNGNNVAIKLGKNGTPLAFPGIKISGNTFACINPSDDIYGLFVGDGTLGTDDVIDVYSDIQFLGGNTFKAGAGSKLWKPHASFPSQIPSNAPYPIPYKPQVTLNLPTTGIVPVVTVSPSSFYQPLVNQPVTFSVSSNVTGKLWSPNLPKGCVVSVALKNDSSEAGTVSAGNAVSFSWSPTVDQIGRHTITFISEAGGYTGFGVVSVNVQPNPAIQAVKWRTTANATSSLFPGGSRVEKAYPGVENVSDAGIASQRLLGDGWISFRFPQVDRDVCMGLSTNSPDSTVFPKWAVYARKALPPQNFGTIELFNNGVSLGTFGNYTSESKFVVLRSGGTLKFYRDSIQLGANYSVANPTPLIIKANFNSYRGAISDCVVKSGVEAEDADWDVSSLHAIAVAPSVPEGGSALTKNGGSNGVWDSEALSLKRIIGNGFFSFRFGKTNQNVSVGLSTKSDTYGRGEPKFAIRGAAGGVLQVFDNVTPGANNLLATSTYTASDFFRMERKNGIVTFYKNNDVLAISTLQENGLLRGEFNAETAGGEITNCVIGGAELIEPVSWQSEVGVVQSLPGINGSSLVKTSGDVSWAAEAVSAKRMTGDGYVQFRIGQTDKRVMVGLTARDRDPVSDANCQYMIQAGPWDPAVGGPSVVVVDKNIWRGIAPYNANDVFRIERKNGVVRYYKNGEVWIDSLQREQLPLMMIGLIHTPGAAIRDCIYSADLEFEPVEWVLTPNMRLATIASDRGSRIERFSGGNDWNAFAASTKKLQKNGVLQFQFVDPTKEIAVPVVDSQNHPIANISNSHVASSDDVLTLWRKDSVVTLYCNNLAIWSAPAAGDDPWTVFCYPNSAGGAIKNCKYGGVAP